MKGCYILSDTNKELERLKREIEEIKQSSNDNQDEKSNPKNELLQFFLGFLLFGGGFYWVLNSFTVTSSWGLGYWSLFGMRLPSGVMLIPLLVGIVLLFMLKKKIWGGMVCALGILVILISLITSIEFHAVHAPLYVYVLMFGMVAAGAGLLIKVLFSKK